MKYDAVYRNGKFFTSDKEAPYADAMAVKDGKIQWIGREASLEPETFLGENVIDLRAKRILPGFVDCHMHAVMLADFAKQISVLPPNIYSIEELIREIRQVRQRQEAGLWIQGWGYDEGKLAEGRAPNRKDLDAGCSDAPVIIQRTCTHICAVNSYALKLAGITAQTRDPEGGKIGRDEKGEPDGILYETATQLVLRLIPKKTDEEIAEDLAALGAILLSQGVTTAADMGEDTEERYTEIFNQAIKKGLKNRIGAYTHWYAIREKGPAMLVDSPYFNGKGQIRLSGVKLIGDGSVSGRTAWCDKAYLNLAAEEGSHEAGGHKAGGHEAEYGMPVCTEQDIVDAREFCKKHQCQLSIHAMGARAIDRAVDLTWQEEPWLEGNIPSVRMEHVAMPSRQAMERAAAAAPTMAWATQPIFLYSEIESYEKNLQQQRIFDNYPIGDWKALGIRFAFSTDAPATSWATPSEPFANLKGAVTRKAWNDHDCGQAHRVDIETAIRLYTAESAPILGFTEVGMLKEGYDADFIILDRDVLEIPPEEIDQVKVEETYIRGERVYKR